MRLVVTGATGNVALLELLRPAPEITEVRAVVRHPTEGGAPYDWVR